MKKRVLDACCGGKHFWFDKNNSDVVFCDKRYEEDILLCNGQHISVTPDVVCDFKNLPFEDNSFYLTVFDPPHLVNKSENAWMVKKYGTLPKDWQNELKQGFSECWRVTKPNGTIVFKWNEVQVPTSKIIDIFGKQPLFGHKSGKRMNTNWLVFMKDAE